MRRQPIRLSFAFLGALSRPEVLMFRVSAPPAYVPPRPVWARYSFIIVALLAAFGAVALMRPVIGSELFFPPFTLAVFAVAVYGGFWPGILATALGVLSNSLFVAPPIGSLVISERSDVARLVLFAITGTLASLLAEGRQRALWAESQQRQWLEVTLSSMGDAVVVTTRDGKVQFMNRIAEDLMGCQLGDALNRSLTEVFRIVNEETRQVVPDPVAKVLETGVVAGLANHTILIRPDGSELPIDDSAAPVRTPDGKISGVVLLFRNVSARRATERKLTEQAERLTLQSALLAQAHDAIFVRDLDRRIVFWNAASERLYGWTEQEAVGRPAHELLKSQFALPVDAIERTIRENGKWEGEISHTTRDGRQLIVESRHVLVHQENGPTVILEINRDATARKAADAERVRLLAEAQAANRVKDDFLTTLSHELRTPLNAILGWAQVLGEPAIDPAVHRRACDAIGRNAQAQARLIDDLLDVSRIVTGKMRMEMHPLDLADVIDASVEAIRPAAEAKGVRLAIGSTEDVLLTADPQRLQQVFWNLLSNAVKFTPRGGEVRITSKIEDSRATISVWDTGLGISPEFLPHVFERFQQYDSSTRRAITGLGLGLAIVRHLTELHGGTVNACSEGLGKGSVFTVSLPIAAVQRMPVDEALTAMRRAQETAPASLKGVRVVVVDDEEDARELLSRALRDRGAEVVTASSAAEGLDAIARTQPDVLLSDIGMAGTDGYDLIHMVRSLPPESGGRVPAIAVTAYSRAEDRMNALTAGYQQHVAKPVAAAELVAMVASLTGRTGQSAV